MPRDVTTSKPSKRPTLRDVQKQQTREALLASAKAVFEARGYPETTVDDIVAPTGASRGTFYLHFSSKAAIMSELVTREREASIAAMRTAVPGHLDSLERLEHWVDLYVDNYLKRRAFIRAWAQAENMEEELQQSHFTDLHERVERYRAAAGKTGRDRRSPEETSIDVTMFTSLAERFLLVWLVDGMDLDRTTVVKRFARFWYVTVYGELPD